MATDAGGTRPLTQYVAGNGQSAVSYQLPAGLIQYVQSVVATIDTTAAGDVQPLLTVTDDANIVVADKQQGQSIDAGGSGRATWALRLTDEVALAHGVRLGFEQLDETVALDLRVFSVFPPLGTGAISSVEAAALTATCTFGAANRRFELPVYNHGARTAVFDVHSLYVQRLDVLAFERLDGGSVIVPAGGISLLTVDNHRGGATLLDLTTPTKPAVINAGTYAFTVWVQWG